MSGDLVLLGRLARLHRATLSLLGFKSTTRRIGEIELTAEEAQKLGQIAAGSSRQYTFPSRIERMFQNYVRESSRAARISLVLMTAVVYLTIPLWVSVLGIPKQSQELMTIASLGLIVPLFAAVTFVQVRYLASDFAEWLLIAALVFEAVFVEIVRQQAEQLGYSVEPSISVLVPVAVIAMARLRVSLNFLFIAIYFLILASEPFWWGKGSEIDGVVAWTINLMLLALLLLGAFLQKIPLQNPRQVRLRNIFNVALIALYFWVLIYEAMRWPDEVRTRGPTGWLLEVLLLTIVMMAAIWSKLSSRRQWAANVLLQLMAYRDSLTGLPNRRAFEDHYERVTRALARSEKKQLVLAVLDLDHFKKLNDDYGHDYGDGALAEIALTLAQFARRSLDMSARLGGEEFALLLYDCDAENARARLAELVQAIAEMKIENRNADRGVLTCSIGAAVVGPNESFGTAYRTADEMLYQVKNAGRNNFALAG
ncbi:GGDEF domain-containing protein [Stenotrophobium rhamnosiphilum]|uniref:GGDEF domain-containing protein n=1 Tax=Stenotrophobium rhamnosiphilum TaxID=2029166 RepID=UPI001374FD1D|nr:GGDEF domain-containing protein [Stenotrophobium rhamnosiphilum]